MFLIKYPSEEIRQIFESFAFLELTKHDIARFGRSAELYNSTIVPSSKINSLLSEV